MPTIQQIGKPRVRLRVLPALLPLNLELQVTDDAIQWRYVGASTWTDLIEISEITSTVEIGTVSTLPPGDSATVVNSGTARNVILDIGIPAGSDGLVQTIVEGDGVEVDATDPNNPTVGLSATTLASLIPAGGTEGQVLAKSSGADYDTEWAATTNFETVTEAITSTDDPAFLRTAGYTVVGEGGALYKSVADTGPVLAGQFISNPGVSQKRWENAEETITPAMFSDIAEMFEFTRARIDIPAADYELAANVAIRAGANIRAETGARFLPTFEPAGAARDTALITLGDGATVNRIEVYHDSGINEFPLDIQIGNNCTVGLARVTGAQYNNNVTDTNDDYWRWASVLIEGDDVRVGQVETDFCRIGLRIFASDRVRVGHYQGRRVSLGLNPRDVTHLFIGSYDIEAVPYADQTRTWNSNGVITGENGILVGGVQDSVFGPGQIVDALEHAIRVGAGVERTNNRLTFLSPKLYSPYGCGFKADDGDAHTTTDLHIHDLYCQDVGRDNEVIATVGTSTWGNKEALSIRNVERFDVNGFTNRAIDYTYSGHYGLWIEKSTRGNVFGVDTENTNGAGIVLSPNDVNMLDVTIRGRSVKSGGDGVLLTFETTTETMNRIDIDVQAALNGGYGFNIEDRSNSTAAFAGPVHIAGFARGNTSGATSVAAASKASSNWFDDTWSISNRQYLEASATYNPASITGGAVGATNTITVTGAAVGGFVQVSGPGASVGITWHGTVSSANTVTYYPVNPGSTVDPASGTVRVRVYPA